MLRDCANCADIYYLRSTLLPHDKRYDENDYDLSEGFEVVPFLLLYHDVDQAR